MWVFAQEVITRARQNLLLLIERLHGVGYRFADPDPIFTPPAPDVPAQLRTLEQLVGRLPLILHIWYVHIGAVCLIGDHPLLTYRAPSLGANHPVLFGDPFVVAPIECLIEEARAWSGDDDPAGNEPYLLAITPDADHKANLSGGSYDIQTPCAAIDAPLLGVPGPLAFVPYLRLACAWGGFPGLSRTSITPEQTALLATLTADLLPL